jgi:NAD(P)H dehydrogenase (quinone)
MHHLIVVAHPLTDSVTIKLTHAYAHELQELGHTQQTHDLYRMRFNPVLAAHELDSSNAARVLDPAVADAQRAVHNADALTVIYPIWWATMPAMMKGYIDRVFARGFAYEATSGVNRGLMNGKLCVMVTLSGSPKSMLLGNGEWQAMQALQDAHIFRASGFDLLEHLHFDEVEAPVPDDVLSRDIESIQSCARRHFSAAVIRAAARRRKGGGSRGV